MNGLYFSETPMEDVKVCDSKKKQEKGLPFKRDEVGRIHYGSLLRIGDRIIVWSEDKKWVPIEDQIGGNCKVCGDILSKTSFFGVYTCISCLKRDKQRIPPSKIKRALTATAIAAAGFLAGSVSFCLFADRFRWW